MGTQEALQRLGGNATLRSAPHGGEEIVFTPTDAADAEYRAIFPAVDGTVLAMFAGRLPAVEFDEGCA